MDWMEFIIGLLNAISWPIVVLITVLSFRKNLTKLMPFTRKLKFKDFEVEFSDEIDELVQNAQTAFPDLKSDPKTHLTAAARHLPNSCVLEAWGLLNVQAQTLVKKHFPEATINEDTPYKDIGYVLTKHEVLDLKKSKLFNELRRLRNKVAHAESYEVGGSEAIQYVDLCFRLIDYFQELNNTMDDLDKTLAAQT